MSDKEDAKKWILRQAEELLKLFEEDTGSPATSKEELAAWLFSARGEFAVEKKAKLLQKRTVAKIEEELTPRTAVVPSAPILSAITPLCRQ